MLHGVLEHCKEPTGAKRPEHQSITLKVIQIPSPKFLRTYFKGGELCSNIDCSGGCVKEHFMLCWAAVVCTPDPQLCVFDVIQKCDAHLAFLAFVGY